MTINNRSERARMVVIERGRLLAIKRTKPKETYWVFPGGEIEDGETIEYTLIREGKEELGVTVWPFREFISLPSSKKDLFGQVEHFYFCDIKEGTLGTGQGPEFLPNSLYCGRYEIVWITLEDLGALDLRPHEVRDLLVSNFRSSKQP